MPAAVSELSAVRRVSLLRLPPAPLSRPLMIAALFFPGELSAKSCALADYIIPGAVATPSSSVGTPSFFLNFFFLGGELLPPPTLL